MTRMKGAIAAALLLATLTTACTLRENAEYRVVTTLSGLQAQINPGPSMQIADLLWFGYCRTNMPCTGQFLRDNYVPSGWGRAEWVEGTFRYADLYGELNHLHFYPQCLALNKGWSGDVWWSHFSEYTACNSGNGSGGGGGGSW